MAAISSIKGCWYKFSARIRDYLDVVDSYYRPADDIVDGQHLSRPTYRISGAAGDTVVINGGQKSRRSSNGYHKSVGHQHHHHDRHHLDSTNIDSARNQISSTRNNKLPPGYSKRKTPQGQVYFVDPDGQKYWYDPSVPKELLTASLDLDSLVGRLSTKWEIRQTSSGKTYFVNHTKKTTQFTDPRLVACKDHLMSIIQHIKCANNNTNTANNNNNLIMSQDVARLNQCQLTGSSRTATTAAASATSPSSQVLNQSRSNSNSMPRNSQATTRCRQQDNDHLRRHLFAALEADARNNRNNRNNQYQRNILSSSHHNLSVIPPCSGVQPIPRPSVPRYSSNNNSQHDSTPATSDTNQHQSRSMNRNESICDLFPTSDNIPTLDQSTTPLHPNRTNKELFDKISILRQELLKQQVIAHPCRIDISRKRIFEESFRVVSQHYTRDLKKRLLVKFKGEEGLDYGGVAREWFFLLSREILNPVHGLFQYTSDDIYNLQINPDSGIVYREHLSYMNFCGRVIGMAVFHGHFIEGHFTLPFYKMLLKKQINLGDIELVDPELHRSLCWILDNDITNVIDTTFTVQHNAFGELQEHELKENGRNIVVTEENKHEYVSLYVNYRCRRGISGQFEALQRGFYELISPNLLENFDEHELELLIGGLSKINVEDWRVHTKLKNCTVDTPLVRWFWELVKSYSEDRRARLLQFVTGSPRVPIQGFKALQGVNSELRLFTIHLIKNACTDNLPKSHTCFNRIDLPPYESYEKLRDKLTQAIEETMGFAMQ